jgi:hypothetical protein
MTRTVFRVKLRLATFGGEEMTWQRLVVDRPSAEEASELIKWAHRLDRENNIVRPFLQNCVVERKKVGDDVAMPPLDSVIASLDAAFALRKPSA